MYSVRRRLLLMLGIGFTVLIVSSSWLLVEALEGPVTGEFDNALLADAQALALLTEQEGDEIEFDYVPRHMPQYEREVEPAYYQFRLPEGELLMGSTRLTGDLPRLGTRIGHPVFRDLTLPDGRAGRMVEFFYLPEVAPEEDDEPEDASGSEPGDPTPIPMGVAVARGRAELDGVLASIRWSVFGGGALAVLLATLLVWRAVAAGFRPIHGIAAQVEALDAENLDARITVADPPVELAPIVSQLNLLLGRLHDAFHRERRFTGNVAHELRTPLAELRSLATVGAKWPDDKDSVVEYFQDVRGIAVRMEAVISDLLLLARCQAGVEQIVPERVELGGTLHATWLPRAEQASKRGLELELDGTTGVALDADRGKLALLLGNALGNAVSYAAEGSTVRCQARVREGRVVLDIENQAAQPLTDAEVGHLTEPFWRKDTARSDGDHAGLGCSLIAALGALMSLDVAFQQAPDGRFRVRITGPGGTVPVPLETSGSVS